MTVQPNVRRLDRHSSSRGWTLTIAILLLLAVALVACQTPDAPVNPEATSSSDDLPAEPVETAQVEPPAGETLQHRWQQGPHASTFVVTEDGVNSSCARCHAPVNWIPTMEDIPESCLTCKFTIDPPPPFIAETEWQHVECIVCHRVDKDEVDAEIAWLAIAPIEEYEEVSNASELCLKCHAGDGISGHFAASPAGAHEGMQCIECHDSHDGSASCSNQMCHPDVLSAEVPGHDEAHEVVGCEACHDASGMVVNPGEEDGIWTTWLAADSAGESKTRPVTSHNTALQAPCERCHFAENPWGLEQVPP